LVWRFYVVPNRTGKPDDAASDAVQEKTARATWGGGVPEEGGGGTVWGSLTYDPQLNLVYFGTGNGSPWNAIHRSDGKSDNLFQTWGGLYHRLLSQALFHLRDFVEPTW